MIAPRWVGQEDADGCAIACMAMMTGRSYAEVRAEFAAAGHVPPPSCCALTEWLKRQGFHVLRRRWANFAGRREQAPPPEECFLWVSVEVGDSGLRHSVLLVQDDVMLDPAHPAPRRPEEYAGHYTLESVAVVTRSAGKP